MSETVAPVGAHQDDPPVGARVRGMLLANSECRSCGHRYRFTDHDIPSGNDVTYDAACPCGCTASGAEYEQGIVEVASAELLRALLGDVRDERPDDAGAEPWIDEDAWRVANLAIGPIIDPDSVCIDPDDGPTFGPRCLGPGDTAGAVGVESRGGLRGRWVGWLEWARLSRFAGNLGGQLVRQRRDIGCVRGRPDHGGDADPGGPTGSDELRSVVTS